MKTIITSLCSGVLSIALQAQTRPNIVLILADDLGYGDLGCYGSRLNRTPNIDRIAADGMLFTDFYSASPVSSPSRAALLTGRYPVRMGINDVFFPESLTGIPPSETTLGEALQQQGYRTGIVGKWHLGHHHQFLPLQNGFDEYSGIPYSNGMLSVVYMKGNSVSAFRVNNDSITCTYTQEALRFIERNSNRPFFLYLAHTMPHVPLACSARFRGASGNGLYSDVMSELDWSVGQVMDKLQELGLEENTIIVFTSDNGGWLTEGPAGGCNAPLFQGKGTPWEGGFRVPMVVKWPGKIGKGTVCREPAAMTDWMPTLMHAAGGPVPAGITIDGSDLMPVLTGTGRRSNHDFAYIVNGRLTGFRSGDWKVMLPEPLRKGNFWVDDVPAHDTLFFNIREDAGEKHNLRPSRQEIYKAVCRKMEVFKLTLTSCPPSLVVTDNEGTRLRDDARQQLIREAISKGVKPKSMN